jgi:hypothetical protein
MEVLDPEVIVPSWLNKSAKGSRMREERLKLFICTVST